jgi:hypothetical protein
VNRIRLVAVISLLQCFSRASKAQDACDPSKSDECVLASQVGIDVQAALRNANGTGLSGLALKKAVLTLETAANVKTGLDINVLIFTLKYQTKKGDTITQTITWGTVPKAAGTHATPNRMLTPVQQSLANACNHSRSSW